MAALEPPPAVKLAAARDLLDRGNLTGKQIVQVEGTAPWQVLLQKIVVRPTIAESNSNTVIEADVLEESLNSSEVGAGESHVAAAERPPRQSRRATFRR
ncbi:MAG: hypothetical protein ACYC3W_10390 [Candidatus Nanopelagicales bacterium]